MELDARPQRDRPDACCSWCRPPTWRGTGGSCRRRPAGSACRRSRARPGCHRSRAAPCRGRSRRWCRPRGRTRASRPGPGWPTKRSPSAMPAVVAGPAFVVGVVLLLLPPQADATTASAATAATAVITRDLRLRTTVPPEFQPEPEAPTYQTDVAKMRARTLPRMHAGSNCDPGHTIGSVTVEPTDGFAPCQSCSGLCRRPVHGPAAEWSVDRLAAQHHRSRPRARPSRRAAHASGSVRIA